MPFYVKGEKIYHYLNAFGLTPWMCLHLFYIMILYLYTWMTGYGYADAALPACEALFDHLSWVIIVSEVVILVLCGRVWQNHIAKMDGSRKCTCILLHSLCYKINTSGYSIPSWIHKRLDERKHDLFLYPHMDCRKQNCGEIIKRDCPVNQIYCCL